MSGRLLCNAAMQSQHCRGGDDAIHASPAFAGGMAEPGRFEAMRLQYFRGNVFVANLPPELTDDELAEAFDPFGIVLSAFVARDPATGKRLRYGFVDIATERAAKLAVAAMNGTEIDGHNLDVRISEKPAAKKKPAKPGFAAHAHRRGRATRQRRRSGGGRTLCPRVPRRGGSRLFRSSADPCRAGSNRRAAPRLRPSPASRGRASRRDRSPGRRRPRRRPRTRPRARRAPRTARKNRWRARRA